MCIRDRYRTMKTKVFLKTVALSAVILFGGIAASAANKNNLIYNSEEKDGVMAVSYTHLFRLFIG